MLAPLENTIRGVMEFTWPMILISVIIAISLRLTYLWKNKKPLILYRELLALFFIVYILCLFQVVTFQDVSLSEGGNNFAPFTEIFRYRFGSRLFLKQVIGNLLMFVPYGFFVSYYIKTTKPYLPFFLSLIASLAIESTQLMIGRVFDIDDIILNILGGMSGYLVYFLLYRIKEKLPSTLKKNWFLNIVSLIVTGIFIYYVYQVVVI